MKKSLTVLLRLQLCDDLAILGLDAPKRYKIDWDAMSDEQLARLAAGEDPIQIMAEA